MFTKTFITFLIFFSKIFIRSYKLFILYFVCIAFFFFFFGFIQSVGLQLHLGSYRVRVYFDIHTECGFTSQMLYI